MLNTFSYIVLHFIIIFVSMQLRYVGNIPQVDILVKDSSINISQHINKMRYSVPWVMGFSYRYFPYLNTVVEKHRRKNWIATQAYHKAEIKNIFDDPHLNQQWYFLKTDLSINSLSHDLDMLWSLGITGKGVVVGILDGGIDVDHPDLEGNFNKTLSYNFIHSSSEIYSTNYSLPTKLAGIISAMANNSICGVGAAPHSTFASLQIFDINNSFVHDERTSKALIYQHDIIDIYVKHWWIDYQYDLSPYPGFYTKLALKYGYRHGRRGLGSLFISGAGDHKIRGQNCCFNGYLQRPEILVFGAISPDGNIPRYTEGCTAILASTLNSQNEEVSNALFSTKSNNMCDKSINGGYGSAGISSGLIALLLSANPVLTVREIINLIIFTSIQYDPNSILNSAGYYYSYYTGFGLLNPVTLIFYSKNPIISNINPEKICSTNIFKGNSRIKRKQSKCFYIYTSGCIDAEFCITNIEQVSFIFTATATNRRSIRMSLTSPSGTTFIILLPRFFDKARNGFHRYRLKILGYFGERPAGVWKLEVYTDRTIAYFVMAELIFYGTCADTLQNYNLFTKLENSITNLAYYGNVTFFYSDAAPNDGIYDREQGRDSLSFLATQASILETFNSWLAFYTI